MTRMGPLLIGLALVAATGGARAEDAAPSLGTAIRDGEPVLSFRYRFETVSDDAVRGSDARASTLRTVLGYRTAAWKGWRAYLEAEDVSALGADLYNNAGAGALNNGVRDRPVVADPDGTGINQAFVSFAAGDLEMRAGRQEIVLGDSRFVGNVGWRQNHQSYDAVRVSRKGLGRFDVDYAFVDNVSRINGGNHDMSSHLLQASGKLGGGSRLTLYGFVLDYDDAEQSALSSMTVGVELAGRGEHDGRGLIWEAEYARQRDAGDNPGRVDAGYIHLLGGLQMSRATVKLRYEVFQGNAGDGQFRTPLATLHGWNGWADKFLATPRDGLEDLSLEVSGTLGAVGWTAAFHDFAAESGGADYGRELDLQLLYTAPWKQGFGVKAALYEAESFAADTTKLMVWTTYSI